MCVCVCVSVCVCVCVCLGAEGGRVCVWGGGGGRYMQGSGRYARVCLGIDLAVVAFRYC